MRAQVVIGAPVHERAWVLDTWFRCLLAQDYLKPEMTHMVFAFGPGHDDTLDILQAYWDQVPWAGFDIFVVDGPNSAERNWNLERYAFMADMRNQLLERVREIQPRYYLSIDTDILLPRGGLSTLVQEMRGGHYDGIAPLTYMTPTDTGAVNAMNPGWTTRPVISGDATVEVAACFGAVLMMPELFDGVDYAPHRQGEDIGWAANARAQGRRLALCSKVRAKHVMAPEMLLPIDERVGF